MHLLLACKRQQGVECVTWMHVFVLTVLTGKRESRQYGADATDSLHTEDYGHMLHASTI